MPQNDTTLHIAEIPYETGEVRFRYSRFMSDDRTRWIRHGVFCEYQPNGQIKSEGAFEFGLEHGVWRDYHENGQLAAEGEYLRGQEMGVWRFWDADGNEEAPTDYGNP